MNSLLGGGMDDLFGFGGFSPYHPQDPFALGPQVILSDSGALSPVGFAHGSGGFGGFGGGGSSHAPSPTLVSSSGSNLAIDLVWDSSVGSAPTGFTSALIASAQALVADFSTHTKTVLYISVGWGEIAGQTLAANALGESESLGYLTNYTTVANALTSHGASLTASNEPTSAQFFVTSAEAKALGLVSGTGGSTSSVDGYIGFSSLAGTGDSWQYAATGTTANQFNLQAVAQHELTEVMGRVSMEGTATYNGHKTYTPLDLFDFSANHTLALSNTGGYFSSNGGQTQMGVYNDAAVYGGDIGDWASYQSVTQSQTLSSGEDAFDAFDRPGYNLAISSDDLSEMVALGI